MSLARMVRLEGALMATVGTWACVLVTTSQCQRRQTKIFNKKKKKKEKKGKRKQNRKSMDTIERGEGAIQGVLYSEHKRVRGILTEDDGGQVGENQKSG